MSLNRISNLEEDTSVNHLEQDGELTEFGTQSLEDLMEDDSSQVYDQDGIRQSDVQHKDDEYHDTNDTKW